MKEREMAKMALSAQLADDEYVSDWAVINEMDE